METNKQPEQTPTDQQTPHSEKPSVTTNRTKLWLIAAVVLIAAAIITVAVVIMQPKPAPVNDTGRQAGQTQSQAEGDLFMKQYGQNCQERDVTFSSAPLRTDDLAYIRPLGAVSDGHVTPTDHVYVGPSNAAAADNTYPVLMPADGVVTEVDAMPAQYIGDRAGQQVAPEDHRIVISHSCRYFSIYIHVHKLGEALKTAAGMLQPGENKQVNVVLRAGDTLGYIGGSMFDWIPVDTTKTLKGFMTPSLYEGEPWKIHTVSPFDLYDGALKTQLEAKSLRTVAPVGGKIDYDQAGKLIGNWFREGTGGYSGNTKDSGGRYWDGHLSVAPDYIDPTSTVVSIGNWTGAAAQFVVSGTADPATVTKNNGMVVYELKKLSYVTAGGAAWNGSSFATEVHPAKTGQIEGAIAFQVMPGEKLKVEKFPGKTAAQVSEFTTAAQLYGR